MKPDLIPFAGLTVSRFIIGGNPFSGFSHQNETTDRDMLHFFTSARIKETLREAERLGVNAHIGRADHHIMRVLMEYWDEGGKIQWIAQTCPELGPIERGIQNAVRGGASACYVHGGVMDHLLQTHQLDQVPPAIQMIRDAGMPAGIAGHDPRVFQWAEQHLDVDFYMCSYYNSMRREERPDHVHGSTEWFMDEDREKMVTMIQTLSRPAIHYKVMAAGRNDPRQAMKYVARHLRKNDAVCVGIFDKSNINMMSYDIDCLMKDV